MRNSETVTFGGSGLDRAAALRDDSRKPGMLWADEAMRVLPVWRGKLLVEGTTLVRLPAGHQLFDGVTSDRIFLGLDQGAPVFALDISSWEPDGLDKAAMQQFFDTSKQQHPDLPEGQVFVELRGVMAELTPRDAELAATARSLIEWHRLHGYCAACGQASSVSMAGWQRDCPSCGRKHFPRTDPVVIMLITFGNRVLLGRSHGWPEKMYSLLAGFVEPGETIEAAVRREVFEEAGIRVGPVEYLASQPWPYPSSLMIGCRGLALEPEITIDPVEIEDALWISREEMLEAYIGNHPQVSPARKGSIASFLVQHWLADRLE